MLDQSQLQAIATSLSVLHSADHSELTSRGSAFAAGIHFDLQHWLSYYESRIRAASGANFYADIDTIRQQLDPLLQSLIRNETPFRLCHNDLVAENCLLMDDKALFIDWEFAQLNNPWFDLASIVHYFQLDDIQVEQFLLFYAHKRGAFEINMRTYLLAHCAVAWLDLLWYLDKFGPKSWDEQADKLAALKMVCEKLNLTLKL